MNVAHKVKILIADPTETFHGLFDDEKHQFLEYCEFIHCRKGSEAIERIKSERNALAGVLVANDIKDPDAISIVKLSISLQPTVPISYLDSLKVRDWNKKCSQSSYWVR